MDSATVLVILLTAGGIALLAWFEINSRRNTERMKQAGSPAQSSSTGVAVNDGRVKADRTKAA